MEGALPRLRADQDRTETARKGAQLIETLVLNQIGLQTILASKAARVV